MTTILVFVFLVLLNVWSVRTLGQRWSGRRRGRSALAQRHRAAQPLATTAPIRPIHIDSVVAPDEPSALAFPVHGLPPGRDGAGVLEAILKRIGGVTRAYVSPVTALAYIDYLPTQVTEAQLAQAIGRGGYRVGDAAHRFNWRQRQGAAADMLATSAGAAGTAQEKLAPLAEQG